MLNKVLEIVIWITIAVILSVVIIRVIMPTPPNTVSVDIAKIVQDFSKKVAQLNGSTEDKKKLSERFASDLPSVLNAYSKVNHTLILVNAAVASGAEDITKTIEAKVFQDIKLL